MELIMDQQNINYYMVRAMSQTEKDFDVFFNRSVVAVGWSEVNFSKFVNVEEIISLINEKYYKNKEVSPTVVGRKRNEIRRFFGISKGDRIVIPYYDSICLATVSGEKQYDERFKYPLDLSNQISVNYLTKERERIKIPRVKLSEGLQRRLRIPGSSVSDLNEFCLELKEIWNQPDQDIIGWSIMLDKQQKKIENDFKTRLLENIQLGKTNLQAGGRGLEVLIKELLEIDGYNATILSTRSFEGIADADIKASKSDLILNEIQLLIQIKHHKGISDSWGATQLSEIYKSDLFNEYKFVLITTAKASKDLVDACQNYDIILIEGPQLVNWIYDSLYKLKETTKFRLGITNIPNLLNG